MKFYNWVNWEELQEFSSTHHSEQKHYLKWDFTNWPISTILGTVVFRCISWIQYTTLWSTQPCFPPGSLNRVPASAGVKERKSPLPGDRLHCVIPYSMWFPVAVRWFHELLYPINCMSVTVTIKCKYSWVFGASLLQSAVSTNTNSHSVAIEIITISRNISL